MDTISLPVKMQSILMCTWNTLPVYVQTNDVIGYQAGGMTLHRMSKYIPDTSPLIPCSPAQYGARIIPPHHEIDMARIME